MHQVTERRRLATGHPLYEQPHRQIIGEANVRHLLLASAAADQDVEVDVDVDAEGEVEAAVDVDVAPEELVLELVAAVEVAARVAMVAPMPRNAVTLSAAANMRRPTAASSRTA